MVWPDSRDRIEQGFTRDLEAALKDVSADNVEQLNESQVASAVAGAAEPWMEETTDEALAAILLLMDRRGFGALGAIQTLRSDRLVSTRGAADVLGRQVAANTRTILSRVRRQNFRRAVTKGDLPSGTAGGLRPDQWENVFGRNRAKRIAVTETTRMAEIAERAAIGVLQSSGVVVRRVWITENDEKVCEICRPLHKVPEHNWPTAYRNGPPAHVECRCKPKVVGLDDIVINAS